MLRWLMLAAFALGTFAPPVFAQPGPVAASKPLAGAELKDYIRAHYTKYEYQIPMRDGVKLFTAVYVPKDDAHTYPMMLTRTPYSVAPYGADKYPDALRPSAQFVKSGYIFVYQDVRGRWMSEGEFVNVRPHNPAKKGKEIDESSDTYDTVEWLIKNVKGHNGKVGITGISYPGFYTVCGMIDAHPAVKAVSPQAPVSEWFIGDDFHHNGCLFLPHCFNFMYGFGKNRPEPTKKGSRDRFEHDTPDGYKFFLEMGPIKNADAKYYKGEIAFWKEVMEHGTYDDFWKARNIRQHVKNIKPAVLTVGGWFDAENLFGALEVYKHAEANAPPQYNHLVMGPWVHGGWSRGEGDHLGDVNFNAKTSEFYRETIEFPFFEYHLKGVSESKHPKAWVFETGTNLWRKFDSWPPKTAERDSFNLYALNGLKQFPKNYKGDEAWFANHPLFDEFVSDPAKPVPFINKTDIGMVKEYMTADQRFASARPDVLVYQGEVLKSDLTIAGPIEVELYVSTTGTDADWVVKVIDVYPDDSADPDPNPTGVKMGGYQQLIRGEPFRGKFRNSFSKPEPFKPGEVTKVKFTMPDVFHTLRPGHRLMVQVQSTWFPLVDRNPQTFCDIYKADASDFKKQTHKVYRDAEHPSRITVGVIK
ncbi:x-pro dipeptidyl-peptidase : Putative hydrolase, CocE/NonD family OS=Singulisphaera acidiphila (strain ATCC BAA-1392 / DSM 18658 / VKM B-2454 / MOB10) GN=Sinac_2220 PE=4 SV=1: Peptidase_S15: PepX_C [Gemmata massiliana]|uniref:Xaa-Pro dipeptidyl-peptidase C-terminal domain-containing protein n=1 Tax=Gemmata massiliana TaxID=1210884 RepID=A0A6P2DJ20_9BACT|nr:CocE/NonD family hydrolase [Gemmata massiliana]VTS02139.1 x-pro dipeptidyl-peptidase : Putative hydrolase, CocE/NonD family OS=Singulisphaera acidiphila (strain ATCC BAA-1392 / DSM 18658 / VKM B-2454 / MOB10) GN=Sinac_2220 PE=4 SV=1: Peptidase_S15: PepX_C [Gemmata massiliana]